MTAGSRTDVNIVRLSMNFDNRSMALNDEATLMVFDRALGDEMTRAFLDDLQHSQEITTAAFRARSWLQPIAERRTTG